MKKKVFWVGLVVLFACSEGEQENMSAAERNILNFAEAYFNYDFQQASELITPESRPWIRFAASNLSQDDLDILNHRESGTTVELGEMSIINDTTISAQIFVENYYKADSIDNPVVATDETEVFTLTAVRRDKQWLVRMEALPKNERHSLD
jgi:hypothetical protein